VVVGISVIAKENLKPGDVLAVYPDDDEKFWLFKISTLNKRNIEGFWFNKASTQRTYTIGSPDKMLFIYQVKKGFVILFCLSNQKNF